MSARHRLAWPAVGLLLALLAAALAAQPPERWDWQPALAWTQPWRWFTPAGIHLSAAHALANGAALAALVLLGWRAGCNGRAALAWLLAWPLTHLALLAEPALTHYAGLSGVLHAGAVVAGCTLLDGSRDLADARRRLAIGALLLAGLTLKIALEAPWQAPVQHSAEWDFPVARIAHATGALSGLLAFAVTRRWPRRPRHGAH